ncbi:MAG: hypothetical protein ACLRVU_09520 [Beduini sp.]|uniref:hypothetical protein n=1 Tax=Beduini sp. TaxID=1922300 RepID=UPI00399F7DFC
MLTLFKKELFVGSKEQCLQIESKLNMGNIKYTIKKRNPGSNFTPFRAGAYGMVGGERAFQRKSLDMCDLYVVYVRYQDLEEAAYLMNKS